MQVKGAQEPQLQVDINTKTTIGVEAGISIYIHLTLWNIITHVCPNINLKLISLNNFNFFFFSTICRDIVI